MSVRYEVRSAALTGLDAEVASLGGDLRTLLARVGMRPDALYDGEGLIRIEQLIHLLSEAAAQLQCPDLGLRVAGQNSGGVMTITALVPSSGRNRNWSRKPAASASRRWTRRLPRRRRGSRPSSANARGWRRKACRRRRPPRGPRTSSPRRRNPEGWRAKVRARLTKMA